MVDENVAGRKQSSRTRLLHGIVRQQNVIDLFFEPD